MRWIAIVVASCGKPPPVAPGGPIASWSAPSATCEERATGTLDADGGYLWFTPAGQGDVVPHRILLDSIQPRWWGRLVPDRDGGGVYAVASHKEADMVPTAGDTVYRIDTRDLSNQQVFGGTGELRLLGTVGSRLVLIRTRGAESRVIAVDTYGSPMIESDRIALTDLDLVHVDVTVTGREVDGFAVSCGAAVCVIHVAGGEIMVDRVDPATRPHEDEPPSPQIETAACLVSETIELPHGDPPPEPAVMIGDGRTVMVRGARVRLRYVDSKRLDIGFAPPPGSVRPVATGGGMMAVIRPDSAFEWETGSDCHEGDLEITALGGTEDHDHVTALVHHELGKCE
jgi:hypothetical protein